MRYLPRFLPMLLLATCVGAGLVPRASWAAGTLVVTLPQGDYTVWLEYKDAKGAAQATSPVNASGTKAALDLAPLGPKFSSPVAVVLDKAGNVGTKPAPAKAGATAEVTFASGNITAVNTLRVRAVGSDGQPASAGSVTVTDAKGAAATRPILPNKDGAVEFDRVPFGRTNVKVLFGDGASLAQDVDVKADHAPGAFLVELAMASPAGGAPANAPANAPADAPANAPANGAAPGTPADQPAASPEGAAPANAPAAPAAPAPSGTGGVGTVIGLVILGAMVYGGYRLYREKGATIPGLLKRVGIELPPDVEPAASAPAAAPKPAPSVPEGTCPFCGQPKDPATGECACSVAAAPGLGSIAAAAPATGGGAPRLVVVQGPALGLSFVLTDAPAVIGRSAENPVPLAADTTVSRRHASVTRQGDSFVVRDEGSSNGTFVNGLRVSEQVLRPGDEIQVGNSRIRFEA